MNFAAAREQVKIILEGVDDIGQVHDYRRHTDKWAEIRNGKTWTKKMQFHVWEITRDSMEEDISTIGNSGGFEPLYTDIHNILVIGHLALNDDDESEKQFQDLIDNIVAAFRKPETTLLNDVALLPSEMQVEIIAHEMFGGVLCHHCQMTFKAILRTESAC